MVLLFIIMIVVIIILFNQNDNLKNENNNLKAILFNRINFCPKCRFDFRHLVNRVNFCPKCGNNFSMAPPSIPNLNPINNNSSNNKKKEKYNDREIKNSLILITGSILIVLAAIAFLTSTWNIAHNIVKTGVILFMLVVFLAISYISDKYLKLKQTSKSFYYIALAYIPIILLSISMFSLFGNYLSWNGDGRYIYLLMSSILVSLIYYINAKKYNNELISIFSIIFQLFSIIFLILIFTNDLSIIFSGLFIYSILISILYMINIIYFNKEIHLNLCTALFIVISGLLVINDFFISTLVFNFITYILLFANMYLVLIKILNKDNIYQFLYPLCIVIIFRSFSYLFDNSMFRQSLILVSFVVIYIYNLARENKINIVTYVEILIIFSIFNMVWLFSSNLLDAYILFGVMTILNLINCVYDDEYRGFSSSMLSIGVMITSISLAIKFDLSSIFIGYVAFLLILIDMLLKKINLVFRTASKWVGIISLVFITLINFDSTIWTLLLFAMFFISSLVHGILKKDDSYKIIAYVYSNIVLFSFLDLVRLDYSAYVIPFTTLLITIAEGLIPKIRNNSSDNYLIISYIFSNLMLIGLLDIYGFIVILILNLVFVYYINYYKKSINYLCIPYLGMIPYLYMSDLLVINNFSIMYIISIISLIIIALLIYTKKSNFYITMFYLYTLFHIIELEQNKYIGILLLLLGTFICYLIKNNKVKDLYKSLLYIFGLILYNTILTDLNLNDIVALNVGIYLILTLLFTRTIFKKYGNGYKVWEYILCLLINLIAIESYSSELDGIIYVAFLALIVIISYIFKFGPIFLICLISIILNVLLLIGSMPWWLYILIIGGVLIGFAIYNEAKDNKKEKINIKEHLDL